MAASTVGAVPSNGMVSHLGSVSRAYPKFSIRHSEDADGMYFHDSKSGTMTDADGSIVFENEYRGLLLEIVRRNDVESLKQYMTKHTSNLGPGETDSYDPYWVAAYHGSTEALRILLDHYTDVVEALDKRGYLLLNVACQAAQLETARFLMDHSQDWPQAGVAIDIHARDSYGMTALLSAATSFTNLPFYQEDAEEHNMILQAHLARAESLMQLLLDRGACSGDTRTMTSGDANDEMQVGDSVLGFAMSGASARLISRLLATGAEADGPKTMRIFNNGSYSEVAHNVTTVHIGALYANVEALQVLLEHNSNLTKTTDSLGRLPLHWVATGLSLREYMLGEGGMVPHVTGTTTLLLGYDCVTINVLDMQRRTALHYACATGHQEPHQVVRMVTLLCDKGADAGLRDADGRTPMHHLLQQSANHTISDVELLEVMSALIKCGAKATDVDARKDTPLHLAARNLGHVQIVKFLLLHGASPSAVNAVGNTPVHEAARGYVGRSSSNDQGEQTIRLAADGCIRKQDEMIEVLLEAAAAKAAPDALLDRPNAAGETPGIIRDATRNKWRAADEARAVRRGGMGQRRGRGGHG